MGLHFLETTEASIVSDPSNLQDWFGMDSVGPHHIAFALPDEAAGMRLRERLGQHGIEMTPVVEAGPVRNTLFLDNNCLLLEAAWPRG